MMDLRRCPNCEKIQGTGTACSTCSTPLVLEDETFFLGKSFGKYRIESIIGIGGMGVVYKALHTTLEQEVALKIIIPELSDEAFTKRFQREARILAGLKHPNIVEVFDFDISPWGIPYYVMEYLEGSSLKEFIAGHPDGLPPPLLKEILSQLVSALSFAHSRGVVHRDLKPENAAVLTYEGRYVVKMLDFGIAKIVKGEGETTTNLTMTGAVLGTPNYMAPEQVSGRNIGPHTDQYALAIMTAEMATGKAIRAGKTLGEILTKDLQEPLLIDVMDPGALSPAFSSAVERATEVDPEDRFPDVQAFLNALFGSEEESSAEGVRTSAAARHVDLERTPTSRISTPGEKTSSKRRKFSLRILIMLISLILLSAAGGFYLLQSRDSGSRGRVQALLTPGPPVEAPMDAVRVLTSRGGVMILEGGGCFYLLDPDHPAAASRIPLKEGENILAPLADKRVALVRGNTVLACDVQKNKREVLIEDLPPHDEIAISRSGAILAVRTKSGIEVLSIKQKTKRLLMTVPLSEERHLEIIKVGEKTLFFVEATRAVLAYDIPSGEKVLDHPFTERSVLAVAMQEELGLIAVGGWFDTLHLFDLKKDGRESTIPLPGKTQSLFFIPDYPTLVIGKEKSLSLWRKREGIIASYTIENGRLLQTTFDESGLLSVTANPSRVTRFSYQDFPIVKSMKVSDREIWALAAAPSGKPIFAGGADGTLYTCQPETETITPYTLHSQGITSIVVTEDKLATASDDKTIAVWSLEDMRVQWRSKAHDYLVNALYYNAAQKALWSSSSDGTVKKWHWPDLEEMEEFSLPDLNGAAIWLNAEETIALVGTWNNRFMVMEKVEKEWRVRENYPLKAEGVYSITALPDLQAAVVIGIYPSQVYVYDWSARRLTPLRTFGVATDWSMPLSDHAALLACNNALMRVNLRRNGDLLTCSVSALFNTDLKVLYALTPLVPGQTILAGSAYGSLFIIKQGDLHFVPFSSSSPLSFPVKSDIIHP